MIGLNQHKLLCDFFSLLTLSLELILVLELNPKNVLQKHLFCNTQLLIFLFFFLLLEVYYGMGIFIIDL